MRYNCSFLIYVLEMKSSRAEREEDPIAVGRNLLVSPQGRGWGWTLETPE